MHIKLLLSQPLARRGQPILTHGDRGSVSERRLHRSKRQATRKEDQCLLLIATKKLSPGAKTASYQTDRPKHRRADRPDRRTEDPPHQRQGAPKLFEAAVRRVGSSSPAVVINAALAALATEDSLGPCLASRWGVLADIDPEILADMDL